ncbi:MAG: DNA mismatch repair protein MutS [Clostridia bacterium]|nr:DNA mismatch repair protein MutS [Clostridia bacterium]
MGYTPMMLQYFEVKNNYKDYILMYRLGDFYEMFFDDAYTASRELELTLTGRNCGLDERAPMCGVPFHKADVYIGRLVEKGYKVAVCEQTEDPSQAKDLVKREVVKIVTPGTVTESSMLSDQKNNFLCTICLCNDIYAIAFADISTGAVFSTECVGDEKVKRLMNELAAYSPSEILINTARGKDKALDNFISDRLESLVSYEQGFRFEITDAEEIVSKQFPEYATDKLSNVSSKTIAALVGYIKETQKTDISFVKELNVYSDSQYLEFDVSTHRNLEITESMRTKEKKGSLLWVLDKTKTAMGARLLRSWLLHPLRSIPEIMRRQAAVNTLHDEYIVREELHDLLNNVLDLERLMAKIAYGSANARDMLAILSSIAVIPEVKKIVTALGGDEFAEIDQLLDNLDDIRKLLLEAIAEDPPLTIREGGIIKDGYNAEIDKLRSIRDGGTDFVKATEAKEREETGIKNLKVGYNRVFGYYIEVTKSQIDLVPEHYIRKQTLTNCERYITQELKEFEATILGANDKLAAMEYSIFQQIRQYLADNSARIQQSAAMLAKIDVYISLATVAAKNRYVCPELSVDGKIDIKNGRHPVVEKFISDSYFVPNDTLLDTSSNRLLLITGPNMAGKSTYMRQVALIVLMAQIGSFVPADSAVISVVDKLFTRVGASDDLASGQSTFMLEMNEVAYILKHATKDSLIVYDEIGRGTSTYDGMSIARAVAEYTLSKKIGAKTLFATHYHELTVLENEFEGVVNYNIAAKKRGDDITFLRKIVRGAADDSYGIEVAKLAGVPNEVIRRAKEILKSIESGDSVINKTHVATESHDDFDMLSVLSASEEKEVADKIRATDINTLTPIEAMNLIYELKKNLK